MSVEPYKILFEQCRFGRIINGYSSAEGQDGESSRPLVGYSGFGEEFENNIWIPAEITSIIRCSKPTLGHLEGMITKDGNMKLIGIVYDYSAYSEDSFEFIGKLEGDVASAVKTNNYEFSGKVTHREAYGDQRTLNAYDFSFDLTHPKMKEGCYAIPSLIMGNTYPTNSWTFPKHWKQFLTEIEEAGFDHPYCKVLKKNPELKLDDSSDLKPDSSLGPDDDHKDEIPF